MDHETLLVILYIFQIKYIYTYYMIPKQNFFSTGINNEILENDLDKCSDIMQHIQQVQNGTQKLVQKRKKCPVKKQVTKSKYNVCVQVSIDFVEDRYCRDDFFR